MTAEDLLARGDLTGAVEEMTRRVEVRPTDVEARTLLFELLCFAGDLVGAAVQYDAIAERGPAVALELRRDRGALAAEASRRLVHEEAQAPDFLGDPPPYAPLHLEALARLRQKQWPEAVASIDRSELQRPLVRGRRAGGTFGSLRDADDLAAPFLEAIVGDRYAWLPFERVSHVRVPAPRRLLDLLWAPASVQLSAGGTREVLLPALYPGSSRHPDDRVRLGRMTVWRTDVGSLAVGVGRRVLLVDDEPHDLFDLGEVELEPAG